MSSSATGAWPSPSSGAASSLSAPAVAERVERLERDGVITGYRAVVDPQAIGFPLAAVVRVRPRARQIHKIPELAGERPRSWSASASPARTASSLRLHVRAIDDLEAVLDRLHPLRADDDVDRPLLAGAAAVAAARLPDRP